MYSFVCQGYLPPWIKVLILSYFVIFCPAHNPLSPESSKNSQIVSLLYSYVHLGLFFRHQPEWSCYKPCERLQCPSSEPSGPLSLSAIAAMCSVGACGLPPQDLCDLSPHYCPTVSPFSTLSSAQLQNHHATLLPQHLCTCHSFSWRCCLPRCLHVLSAQMDPFREPFPGFEQYEMEPPSLQFSSNP